MRFLDVLRTRPAPLGRAEKIALIAGSIVAAFSRVLARGHSMWDWDEALFCLGMRDYNVVQHHPHPPGYPLFIAAGRFVKLFVHSDLLALQDRKSTRLNSSHLGISYAVFCLKKKNKSWISTIDDKC